MCREQLPVNYNLSGDNDTPRCFLGIQGGIKGCGAYACISAPYLQQVSLQSENSNLSISTNCIIVLLVKTPFNTFNWKNYL